MSFIPIMEVSKNGTEALEKKEEERDKVDQEVSQEEEIEGTRSMIAKEGHQSLTAFFFRNHYAVMRTVRRVTGPYTHTKTQGVYRKIIT